MANESTLLGALMLDGAAFADVAKIVRADDFESARRRLVFEAMANLQATGAHAALSCARRLTA